MGGAADDRDLQLGRVAQIAVGADEVVVAGVELLGFEKLAVLIQLAFVNLAGSDDGFDLQFGGAFERDESGLMLDIFRPDERQQPIFHLLGIAAAVERNG